MRLAPSPNSLVVAQLPAKLLRLLALLLCVLVPTALGGCRDDGTQVEPKPADPETVEDPAEPEDVADPEEPEEPAAERAERMRLEHIEEMDDNARGLIASFRARCYDPLRDVGLNRLRGTATLEKGDVVSTYSIAFDAAQVEDEQITVKPLTEPEGTAKGSLAQVVRYAIHSLRGAYNTVVYYLPPVKMLYTSAEDRARLVTAQPHKDDIQVVYRFDDRDLVSVRGAIAPRGKEVSQFEWRFFRGRYLLDNVKFKGPGTVIEYEYDEWNGIVLLSKATIARNETQIVVTLDYEGIEKGEPETPLVPDLVGPEPEPGARPDDALERPR